MSRFFRLNLVFRVDLGKKFIFGYIYYESFLFIFFVEKLRFVRRCRIVFISEQFRVLKDVFEKIMYLDWFIITEFILSIDFEELVIKVCFRSCVFRQYV